MRIIHKITYFLVLYAVRPLRIMWGTFMVEEIELRSLFPIGHNQWKSSSELSPLDLKETLAAIFPTENPSTISGHFIFAKNGGRSYSIVWINPEWLGKERHLFPKSQEVVKGNL
jgi:hypothetical protein